MLDFLREFGRTIISLINFAWRSLVGLYDLIVRIPQMTVWLTGATVALPTWIIPFFSIGVTVSIVLFIISKGVK